jgi:putative ABC transport system permease protein
MQWVWKDLQYALRSLRKQPAFSSIAILTIALGIGAATTMFSVIQNVLLDPFPYKDADRVVTFFIHDVTSSRPGGRGGFRLPEFLDYREQNHVFEEVIGGGFEDVLYQSGEGTEQYNGGIVTSNLFSFLGVPALLGRTLTPDDARPGAPPVFVMSYKLWFSRFNLDPAILGRSFVLNGVSATLVGIMPERFTKLGADLWRCAAMDRGDPDLSQRYFMFQARLMPGVSIAAAQADLETVAHQVAERYPKDYPPKFTIQVESWLDSLVGQFRKTLYTLAAAVGLLLLISCGNVANMLLARATVREREMAIRASLGANPARLTLQLLIESLLLALLGALPGCLLAHAGIKGLVALMPDGAIPHEALIRINTPVLLFTLGATVLTAVLFGLAPAIQTAKLDITEPLKDSGRGGGGASRKGGLRNALVIGEVALSLVLLAGAGLFMRSFVKLLNVDLGLNPDNILVARLPLPRGQYTTAAAKQRFFEPLLRRLSVLPGVVAATATSSLPPYGGIRSEIEIAGKTHQERWDAIYQLCSEGYFPTLGLKLLRGRTLSEMEANGARKVAVVNQALVRKFFGQEDPIGRFITIKMLESLPDSPVPNPAFEVIGVISDARNQGIRDEPMPEMFIPYNVTGAFERGILVRTAGDPHLLLNSVRKEIWAVDRNVALTLTGSLQDYLKSFSYAEPRFSLVILGVFAGVGLVLVAIGVYSVIAYAVSRQTHEIGIRMALGAERGRVLTLVMMSCLRLIASGAAAGLLMSLALSRIISSEVWGISPFDAATFFCVTAVVLLVGMAACYIPARRATRVDPLTALRYE